MAIETRAARETEKLGESLGKKLKGGDFICLFGTLGCGKTTFTKGLARGAGFKGQVSSPTFILERPYKAKTVTIHHLDLYRVADSETGDIGLEEFLSDPDAATVVEWPEAGRAYYPKERLEIHFKHGRTANARRVNFRAYGERAKRLLAAAGGRGQGAGGRI